jgi:hypothetical protein
LNGKEQSLKVHIQEPCNEKWNEMTPQQQGRHCAKCDKVVTDFSRMQDEQILNYLDKNDNTCGRFQHWQLEKELQLPTLHNPWTRWIKTAAFGGFLFAGAMTGKAQTNPGNDTIAVPTETIPVDTVRHLSRIVSGTIQQPDDSLHRLHSIRFSIDTFNFLIPLDSAQISFILPDTITGDSMVVELISDIDSTLLDLKLAPQDTTSFLLVYDDQWLFIDIANIVREPQDSAILHWDHIIPPPADFTITTTQTWVLGGFTTGMTTMVQPTIPFENNPMVNMDKPKSKHIAVSDKSGVDPNIMPAKAPELVCETAKGSRDLMVYNKRKSSVWWWLLPIPLLLFFAGYYWKKKQTTVSS